MRTKLLAGILAMLSVSLLYAYEVPGTDAPAGAEVYILTFEEAGALKYEGGIAGLKGTAEIIRGPEKNAGANPDVVAYLAHLDGVLDNYGSRIAAALARPVTPLLRYHVRTTGMAVLLTAAEARQVAAMPGVLEVRKDVLYELDTDAGPQWIGADSIWDGSATPDSMPNMGEGVLVGVLDTGVNMDHPSFSDAPEDAYVYTNPFGAGVYIGACTNGRATEGAAFICNDKLVGAWDFADPLSAEDDGPEDSDGHGSHTASTAVGNYISGPFLDGEFLAPSISGVARHATLVTYDVCFENCPFGAIQGGIDQALLDGVDVINFSISGGTNPWFDFDRDFLDLVGAGTVVSASAGNDGPTPGSVAHRGPWVMTVANQTHNRINKNDVSVVGGPPGLQDLWGQLGSENNFGGMDVTDGILWAGQIDAGNFDGCDPWPMGNEFSGSIALISRGGCNFSVKLDNAEAAGAVAVIVFNHLSDIPFSMGSIESASIPSLMIGLSDGEALRDHIIGNPGTMVTMEAASQYIIDDNLGSWTNSGSSRGPNPSFDVTKPDLGGPGTNIFAAYANHIGAHPQFAFLTGTSMSSPHAAGAAALMKSMHPDWTPSEIKSALMMTSGSGLDEFGDPANPDIEGSGTIDLARAARSGLVMDETFTNYLNANPTMGGNPATLNLPSVRSGNCNGTCQWTRTVCTTLDSVSSWTIAVPPPNGYDVSAEPANFDLLPADGLVKLGFESDPGATSSCQTITLTVTINDMALVTAGDWVFDRITFSENGMQAPDNEWTIAVLPTGVAP